MFCIFNSGDLEEELDESETKNMTCYERTQNMQWVGIVGLSTSRKVVMVASLLSIFQIPSIGTLSSSDELSDKTRYFLAIVKLIVGVMTIFHLYWNRHCRFVLTPIAVFVIYDTSIRNDNSQIHLLLWLSVNSIVALVKQEFCDKLILTNNKKKQERRGLLTHLCVIAIPHFSLLFYGLPQSAFLLVWGSNEHTVLFSHYGICWVC